MSRSFRARCARCCWFVEDMEAPSFLRVGHVIDVAKRSRARPRRVVEYEEAIESDLVHEAYRLLEVALCLTGITNDDVTGQRQVRTAFAEHRDLLHVLRPCVPASHFRKDAIGSGLDRQMQIRAQAGRSRKAAAIAGRDPRPDSEVVKRRRSRPGIP